MFLDFLRIALRRLWADPLGTFITLAGTSLSFAACILIGIFLRDQTTYNRSFPDADRIFQLQTTTHDLPPPGMTQRSPLALDEAFAHSFHQVEASTYLQGAPTVVAVDGRVTTERFVVAYGDVFGVFKLQFLQGSPTTALISSDAIAVSAKTARRLFGSVRVAGRTLTTLENGGKRVYRISAVFADPPANTTTDFHFVRAMRQRDFYPREAQSWALIVGQFYARLHHAEDGPSINRTLNTWAKARAPVEEGTSDVRNYRFELVPLPSIYLRGGEPSPGQQQIPLHTVILFAYFGMIILAMAIANIVNIASAKSRDRSLEMSTRKLLGARTQEIVFQALVETMLVPILSIVPAMIIVETTLPAFRSYLKLALAFHYLGTAGVLWWAILLAAFTTLAGGLVPALALARAKPGDILRSWSRPETRLVTLLRQILVCLQFATVTGLLCATIVVWLQIRHLENMPVGFDKHHLVQIRGFDTPVMRPLLDPVATAISKVPGVIKVARTSAKIGPTSIDFADVTSRTTRRSASLQVVSGDYDYFAAMGVPVLAGRALNAAAAGDDITRSAPLSSVANVVINVAAAQALGLDPMRVVGSALYVDGATTTRPELEAVVVGLVPTLRLQNTRAPAPAVIYVHDTMDRLISAVEVRYAGISEATAKARLARSLASVDPLLPMDGTGADDALHQLYDQERLQGALLMAFTLLAATMTALGLVGLIRAMTTQTRREVGIRRVVGASRAQIGRLMSRRLGMPLFTGLLLGLPLAGVQLHWWLSGFHDRVPLGVSPFVLASVIALLFASSIATWPLIGIARQQPGGILRYE